VAPPTAATVGSLLAQIISERAVFPVFQPIVDLASRKIVGAEALARGPAGSPLEFPDALFRAATEAGVLTDLDQICVTRALRTAQAAGPAVPSLVFVNAEPAALHRPPSLELRTAVEDSDQFRIVLEFTERALSAAPAALLHVADRVHASGDAVALDDVGTDPLSLAFMPLVEPEVVKLDMHLLRSPHDPGTTAVAATVFGFAERTGATILAEGVETEDDAANALALGARWGQGWLFGRPGPLAAIAGRPVDRGVRLRPPQPGLRKPAGTPFGLASTRNPVRTGDPSMIGSVIAYVLTQAAGSGPHAMVLVCAPNDPGQLPAWLPRLTALRAHAGYVGLLSPALPPGPHPIHTARLDGADPIGSEATLAVLGPHMAIALCMRRAEPAGSEPGTDFVLTQDHDMVRVITRMIMQRFHR
jgi:EAL domain-containing protein (putative c-di-GMP-specific phosphodiesterase class I)